MKSSHRHAGPYRVEFLANRRRARKLLPPWGVRRTVDGHDVIRAAAFLGKSFAERAPAILLDSLGQTSEARKNG